MHINEQTDTFQYELAKLIYRFKREYDLNDYTIAGCLAPDSEEVQKMKYFDTRFADIFEELLSMGDWYDSDDDGTIQADEKLVKFADTRRTRGRRAIVRVK